MDSTKLIRMHELKSMLGNIDRRTIDRWEQKGEFPKRIKMGTKTKAWRLNEIEAWINARQKN